MPQATFGEYRFASVTGCSGGPISSVAMAQAHTHGTAHLGLGAAPYNKIIELEQGCHDGDGACLAYNGFGVPWTEVQMRGSVVSVQDQQDPTISGVSGSLLSNWRRSSQTIYWTGNDNTGVRTTVAYINNPGWGVVPGTQSAHSCDYRYRVPCSNRSVGYWVDTTAYTNGAHNIILRAFDASNVPGYGAQEGVTGLWGNWGDHAQVIYIDNALPTAPASIRDSGGIDAEWSTSPNALTANWVAGSDANSGVNSYRLCFSTAANCSGTVVFDQNVGNVPSRTATSLTLTQGTRYYSCVKTIDNALDTLGNPGNESASWTCSNGQRVDSVAPPAPAFRNDGLASDIDWQSSTNTIQANWTATSDSTSGIDRYEYCISTLSQCTGTVLVNWTNNAMTRTLNRSGLSLTNGTTYYVAVRTYDVAGNSITASTDGVKVDSSSPNAILVSPPNNSNHPAWPALTATYDETGTVSPGQLTFQLCSDSTCSTVVESGTSAAGLADGANGNWTPTAADGSYWWRAQATDSAGNTSSWTATRIVKKGVYVLTVAVDNPTPSMGDMLPGSVGTVTTTITVSSDAPNGYQLHAQDLSNTWAATSGPNQIPDWTGTVATPTVWPANTLGYFGSTVRSATSGRLAKWGTAGGPYPEGDFANNYYAGLTASPQLIHLRSGYSITPETVVATWRTAPSATQASGLYSTTITLSIIPNP